MADQVPNATYNYTRPPPRGKELSTLTAMMKHNGKRKKSATKKVGPNNQAAPSASSSAAPSTSQKSMALTRAGASKNVVGSINGGDGDDDVEISPSCELNTEAIDSAKAAVAADRKFNAIAVPARAEADSKFNVIADAARADADRKFHAMIELEATLSEAKANYEAASEAAAVAKSAAESVLRKTTRAINANSSLTPNMKKIMMNKLLDGRDGRTRAKSSYPSIIADAKAAALAAATANDFAQQQKLALQQTKRTLANAEEEYQDASTSLKDALNESEKVARQILVEALDKSRAAERAAVSVSGSATFVCDWAQAIHCTYPCLKPMPCQRDGCDKLVHHLCQSAWEQSEGKEDNIAVLCCVHHPEYINNVQNEEDSRLTKKAKTNKKKNVQNEGDSKLKDPPEVVVVNKDDEGGDRQLKDSTDVVVVNSQDEEGESKLKDPPLDRPEVFGLTNPDYQMAGVDDCVEYKMAPPMDDVTSPPPLADVIGDQWNLSKKKLSLEGFHINATKSLVMTRRRAAPSQNTIVVVWSFSMERDRGGNRSNSQRMSRMSSLIRRIKVVRVLFMGLIQWFGAR
jgi:hypothetical protein